MNDDSAVYLRCVCVASVIYRKGPGLSEPFVPFAWLLLCVCRHVNCQCFAITKSHCVCANQRRPTSTSYTKMWYYFLNSFILSKQNSISFFCFVANTLLHITLDMVISACGTTIARWCIVAFANEMETVAFAFVSTNAIWYNFSTFCRRHLCVPCASEWSEWFYGRQLLSTFWLIFLFYDSHCCCWLVAAAE